MEAENNIVESALAAGRAGITANKSPLDDGVPYIVLRDEKGAERIEFLTERFATPPRKTGIVKLHDEASFQDYWARQHTEESAIYGSTSPGQFVAIMDDHGAKPGFREHRAVYALKHSKEWLEWTGRHNQKFDGTVAFAEWLENHIPDIINPEGARMLEIALNLRITQNAAYSKAVRLADGNTEFAYTNAVEGATSIQGGQVRIPDQFVIAIPVFEGIGAERYQVEARFRYRLNGSSLSLWYELVRPHKVIELAFSDILTMMEEVCKTKVLFGTPD